MASVVKCKTCGGNVSSEASLCPHCGQKDPNPFDGSGCLALLILAPLAYFAHSMGLI